MTTQTPQDAVLNAAEDTVKTAGLAFLDELYQVFTSGLVNFAGHGVVIGTAAKAFELGYTLYKEGLLNGNVVHNK